MTKIKPVFMFKPRPPAFKRALIPADLTREVWLDIIMKAERVSVWHNQGKGWVNVVNEKTRELYLFRNANEGILSNFDDEYDFKPTREIRTNTFTSGLTIYQIAELDGVDGPKRNSE